MHKITLATLPQATAQQVFDQATRHLLTQGTRASTPDGYGCRYRNDDGLQCAAGCFVSDDEYAELFPGGADEDGGRWEEHFEGGSVPKEHADLIQELQDVHDRCLPANWRGSLRELAGRHKLSSAAIDEFPSEPAS